MPWYGWVLVGLGLLSSLIWMAAGVLQLLIWHLQNRNRRLAQAIRAGESGQGHP